MADFGLKGLVSVVFGTRPEAIKLAPVIDNLRKRPEIELNICAVGQHRELLQQVLDIFRIKPDVNLDLMGKDQSLGKFASRAFDGLDEYLGEVKPNFVVVQGDTTTAFCAALSAFYRQIAVGHVEAGLRTGRLDAPFPEEANRSLIGRIARLHFAPTSGAAENLRKEGIPESGIYVTGNTIVDALRIIRERVRSNPPVVKGLPSSWHEIWKGKKLVLITAHRRESFDGGLNDICEAIVTVADKSPEARFVWPTHLNPRVREIVDKWAGRHIPSNLYLLPPLSYPAFVVLLLAATVVLTDSGGVQEEAATLGIPLLVTRETTERPEVLVSGEEVIVGTDKNRIMNALERKLNGSGTTNRYSSNIFGDGRAAAKIGETIVSYIACRRSMR